MESYLPIIIIVGFLIVFPIFWCAIVFLVGLIGGWQNLAGQYSTHLTYNTSISDAVARFSGESMEIGFMGNYRSTTNIALFVDGILLSQGFLFKFGHPPMFIPKSEIQGMKWQKHFFRDCLFLTLPSTTIRIYGRAGKAIYDRFSNENS